jgi:prephenate dehydrogenase
MRRITIIGLGLIGGSIALSLKQAGLGDIELVGYTRSSETAIKALKRGAVDKIEDNLVSAVDKAEIVVLATPVMAMKEILEKMGPHLSHSCIVTDAASTKVKVMEWAEKYLPSGIKFIGGHPMAGKELSGIEAAEADLFKGCTYCIVQGEDTSSEEIKVITDLVKYLGANPFFITASEHDNFVAGISHLPLIISSSLVMSTTQSPYWQDMSVLAAGGYRDVTRLASQHPVMNRDICLTNQKNILKWIDEFTKELNRFRQLVIDGDQALDKAFIQAQQARHKWIEEHDKGD